MKFFFFALLQIAGIVSQAQNPLSGLPSGGNTRAKIAEQVGLTDVEIEYSRPAVKGRTGKIWGSLVHKGFTDQGFGSSKSAPWRAGANENTTISFSRDVMVEGKPVPKGKYGLFIAYDSLSSILILSKNSVAWGSYFYDPKDDLLRVEVKPSRLEEPVERLRFDFMDQTENSATVALEWEHLRIPFKVSTDYVQHQLAVFREELRTNKGFHWSGWRQAAQWAATRNTNLEEALLWSDSAAGPFFGGANIFATKTTKAEILRKLGRVDEANALMKSALPLANVVELHNYGRSLLAEKKAKEAMEVFQMNYQKNPNEFTTKVGLARGYAANKDFKNALKYAKLALPQAPDPLNKSGVEGMIIKLQKGEDVN